MVNMKLSRAFSIGLGLVALLSQACGSDSSPKGPGGGGDMSAGSTGGGSSSGGPSTCTSTRCKNDFNYTIYPQAYCDAFDKTMCAAQMKAEVACALANEGPCTADGMQDYAKVQAACQKEIDALTTCSKALAASGGK